MLSKTSLALAALLAATTTVPAQVGELRVQVNGPSGEAWSGATVTLSHETGYVQQTSAVTGSDGLVVFPVLRAGEGYAIEVDPGSIGTLRFEDIRVQAAARRTVDVCVVFADPPGMDGCVSSPRLARNGMVSTLIDELLADLPRRGRDSPWLLASPPGFHGGSARDLQVRVGGIREDAPVAATSTSVARVHPASIEEIEIVGAGAASELARIAQKQGSNDHEGVAELYLQSSEIDSNGDRGGEDTVSREYETTHPLFQLSGPILRDRLWYRASYERHDREDPVALVPGLEIYERDVESTDLQLTWQVTPRNRLALAYRDQDVDERNVGIDSATPAGSSLVRNVGSRTQRLNWTASSSARALVDTVIAWQDGERDEGSTMPGRLNDCLGEDHPMFLRDAQCRDFRNGRVSGAYPRAWRDERERFTLDVHTTTRLGAVRGTEHQLKAGFSIENERRSYDWFHGKRLTYDEEPIPSSANLDHLLHMAGIASTRLATSPAQARTRGTSWSMFAEHRVRILRGLTITAGLRLDRTELRGDGRTAVNPTAELASYQEDLELLGPHDPALPFPDYFTGYEAFDELSDGLRATLCPNGASDCVNEVNEVLAIDTYGELHRLRRAESIDVTNTDASPFFAVAWSPGADGKTTFRFAAGRHYGAIPLTVPSRELAPGLTDVEQQAGVDDDNPRWFLVPLTPRASVTTVAHDLRTPYHDELALAFERELWPETSLRLSWIRRDFRDGLQDVNINVAAGDHGRCARDGAIGTVVVSPGGGEGSGVLLVDEFTGEVYEDTDPGSGDGRVDDCTGRTFYVEEDPFMRRRDGPDGRPDPYLQNPFWGDVFEIRNTNRIDHEALVVELVRRHFRGWAMHASYTWSETIGDAEPYLREIGEDPALNPSVRGYLSHDQRHVVKVDATTATPWGVRLGASLGWQSGLPYSIVRETHAADVLPPATRELIGEGFRVRRAYPTGARNDQRNPAYWNLDLKVAKDIELGEDAHLRISAEVFNALDDETYQIYNPFFETGHQVNGVNEAIRRFGRRWQLGVRIGF